MLRVLSLAILIMLTIAVVGSIAVATLSVFFWTADAGTASLPGQAAVVAAMGLRFKRSFRLDQLVRSNVSGPSMSYSIFSRWSIAKSQAHPKRVLLKLGIVAAFVCGGYLGVLLGVPSVAPIPPSLTPAASAQHAPSQHAPSQQANVSEPPARVPLMAQPLEPIPSEVAKASPAGPPPSRDAPPLSSDEVLEAQAWLKAFGFDPGPLDGMRGPQTATAIKRYQAARQKEETGLLDRPLLQQIRQQAGQSGR